MEFESGSLGIDNTPTRINCPPLDEYNHCILKNSNARIINEEMIPRILPEAKTAQALTTPNNNLICSSPLLLRSNIKRSPPVVCALPDDLAKSNEVFKHIYGSGSFTDSPIFRNSCIKLRMKQECHYGVTPCPANRDPGNISQTTGRKSNVSSVMSIELIMNPVSPKKDKKEVSVSPGRGVSEFQLLEKNCVPEKVAGKEKRHKTKPYDQYIVTIKLPGRVEADIESQSTTLKKSSHARKLPHVTTSKVVVIDASRKRDQAKQFHRTKKDPAGGRKSFERKKTDKRSAKRARHYVSDEEYKPSEEPTTSKKRGEYGRDGLKRKRRIVERSKNGCWTCRIRHKGCNEEQPKCGHCQRLNLPCDYSLIRPKYMSDHKLHAEKLIEIRHLTDKVKKRKPRQG